MAETIHLTVQDQIPVGLTTEQARVINAVSPTAEVERVEGGVEITTHDLNGTTTATLYDGAQGAQGPAGPAGQDGQPGRDGVDGTPGAPGQDGADGVSPTVTVTDITGGHRVTITDADGTKTVDVMDGADGQPGQAGADGQDGADGFSPIASVSKSGGTATITITDKTGTTTATVSDGATGPQGPQGEPGEDYVLTAQDKQDIANLVDVPVAGPYRLIKDITISEETAKITVIADGNNNPFSLTEVIVCFDAVLGTGTSNGVIIVNSNNVGNTIPYLTVSNLYNSTAQTRSAHITVDGGRMVGKSAATIMSNAYGSVAWYTNKNAGGFVESGKIEQITFMSLNSHKFASGTIKIYGR